MHATPNSLESLILNGPPVVGDGHCPITNMIYSVQGRYTMTDWVLDLAYTGAPMS